MVGVREAPLILRPDRAPRTDAAWRIAIDTAVRHNLRTAQLGAPGGETIYDFEGFALRGRRADVRANGRATVGARTRRDTCRRTHDNRTGHAGPGSSRSRRRRQFGRSSSRWFGGRRAFEGEAA